MFVLQKGEVLIKKLFHGLSLLICFIGVTHTPYVLAAPHQHGKSYMNLVLEGNELSVELQMTASDVVGFEYLPTNKSEIAVIDDSLLVLNNTKAWLTVVGGQCVKSFNELINPLDLSVKTQNQEKPKHADFKAQVRFECTDAQQLSGLSINLQDHFSQVNEIEVQWIIHNRQGLTIIDHNNHEISFKYD